MGPPGYFKRIQSDASKLWDQLESDPVLAGPWRQLFNQVQSPRHVVSELLQNADDAGATDASVEISNGEFIFSHNGEDFNEEQFASLCRFGFSNKRTLHTIGFRGVGFKSTFSLGNEVHLVTPTLSVAFEKQRFTEPVWTESSGTFDGRTEVRVVIQNQRVQQDLVKNLKEWSESPASLLFFNNIRRLRFDEGEIRWEARGSGPVEGSEWMSVSNTPGNQYLLVRSTEEEFPEDALNEIKDERMTPDDGTTFPPCRVEIVLGMEGRLFVVLPTGVRTQLPFACNAPFIQDPARTKIKEPASSPTNRWLLQRAGELAADAMLAWLDRKSLPIEERCYGYGLLPDVDREESTIEGSCGAIVEESFEARIEGTEFLLAETGTLEPPDKCLAVPGALLDVWSPSQVSTGFSLDGLPILSRHVSERDQQKLINWGHVKILEKSQVIETLKNKRLPRPRFWRQLLCLWDYVSTEVTSYRSDHRNVHVFPVRGKESLYAASEVVRPGERRALKPADWEFLAPYLLTLDPNWVRALQQWRNDGASNDEASGDKLRSALGMLRVLGLDEATSINQIINKVADAFFSQGSRLKIQDCARLAHIAAKLGANVPGNFKFVNQDAKLRSTDSHPTFADIDGFLDQFVDEDWYKQNVLHDAYMQPSETCTDSEWRQWVRSAGSLLRTFVPLGQITRNIWSRTGLTTDLRRRGFDGKPYFHYKRDNFRVTDWDFDSTHWKYWNSLAKDGDRFWATLMAHILEQPHSYWSGATSARASQLGNTYSHYVTQEPLLPQWIIRFQGLPCLTDTWGQPRQPAEVFRRTPETEPLLDVEPFVRADLDTEPTRPLLKLLGVRDKPTGPERILERLRALAGINPPLLPEVQKWCHSLDQLFDRCSTSEVQEIKAAFANDRLTLTDQSEWVNSDEVFLNSDIEGVPGTVLIHPSLRDLSFWRKIGVPERPTADMEIEWLKGLPSNGKLSTTQTKRIRRMMPVYPGRIWSETGHWLNLEGNWAPVGSLIYSLTMQSLSSWSHLFPGVKEKTSDFQSLSSETCQSHPFSALPTLAEVIEERFQGQSGLPIPQERPWLIALGTGLKRITLDDPNQMERVRELAHRLSQTRWQVARGLKSEPYIDGTPAGTPRPIDVLWRAHLLYVQEGSPGKMARLVPQEISKAFNLQVITEAIKLCYERSPDFVHEYLEDNFDIAPPADEEELDRSNTQEGQSDTGKDQGVGIEPSQDGRLPEDVRPEEPTPLGDEDNGNDEPPTPGPPRPPRPARKSLIERFAQARGFAMNGTGKFDHPDGRSVERTSGNAFPWELKSAQGDILQYYWPEEHCIEQEPLQLDADIWELCQRDPELYSLVLIDVNGIPFPIPGSQLVEMRKQDRLVLYPATYKLEYRGEGSQ